MLAAAAPACGTIVHETSDSHRHHPGPGATLTHEPGPDAIPDATADATRDAPNGDAGTTDARTLGDRTLEDRYGRRTPADVLRRRLQIAFAGFVAVVVALGVWIAWDRAGRGVDWEEVQFAVRSDAVTELTFEVVIHRGETAVCTVRARNRGFAEVGLVDARVGPFPDGAGRVTVTVPTSERAVNADVKACVPG